MVQDYLLLLWDAVLDTLKLLPFLFAAYLLIEFIEHRASSHLVALLNKFGRWSPALGAVTGLVPQCGFSVTAAKLYAGRLISFGTLAAVFIATSDEAIPVLLSHPSLYGTIWKLLLIKLAVACIAGFLIDWIFPAKAPADAHSAAHGEMHEHCDHDECGHGIWRPAIQHTLKSALYIFLVILAVSLVIFFIGEDRIALLLNRNAFVQPLISALIGFIPNCASSILLTELYASGILSFGSLVAGLMTNTGIGYLILFRSKHDLKRNILLVALLLFIGLLTGYILQLTAVA